MTSSHFGTPLTDQMKVSRRISDLNLSFHLLGVKVGSTVLVL